MLPLQRVLPFALDAHQPAIVPTHHVDTLLLLAGTTHFWGVGVFPDFAKEVEAKRLEVFRTLYGRQEFRIDAQTTSLARICCAGLCRESAVS